LRQQPNNIDTENNNEDDDDLISDDDNILQSDTKYSVVIYSHTSIQSVDVDQSTVFSAKFFARPRHTRPPTYVRYEAQETYENYTISSTKSFFSQVLVFFEYNRGSKTYRLALIEKFAIASDGPLLMIREDTRTKNVVVEASCIKQLIGLVHDRGSRYIITRSSCLFNDAWDGDNK